MRSKFLSHVPETYQIYCQLQTVGYSIQGHFQEKQWFFCEKQNRKKHGTWGRWRVRLCSSPAVGLFVGEIFVALSKSRCILRMDERRTVRQVLLQCVKPSLFGDVPDLNIDKALNISLTIQSRKSLCLDVLTSAHGQIDYPITKIIISRRPTFSTWTDWSVMSIDV